MAAIFWNARQLLDCYPLRAKEKCTGTTKKGTRCGQTFIDRKSESDQILSVLSSKNVVEHGMDDRMKLRLQTLAELTLCPRWHRRSQVDAVYLKWSRIIDNFINEERARVEMQRWQIQRLIRAPQPLRPLAIPVIPQEPPVRCPQPAREVRPVPVPSERRPQQARNVSPQVLGAP